MSKRQAEKRPARQRNQKLYSLLTKAEKRRLRKARVAKKVTNKSHNEPRVGIKGWIMSQPNLTNAKKIKELL